MEARAHVEAHAREFIDDLKQWLAIPRAEILGAPLVFVAIGLDSDRPHAPNERVDTSLLLRGAEVSAYLWEELATVSADLTDLM
jgi:acetylornithine deacetylase/succinyl-diaminopimelate desuccinylase-like protein